MGQVVEALSQIPEYCLKVNPTAYPDLLDLESERAAEIKMSLRGWPCA